MRALRRIAALVPLALAGSVASAQPAGGQTADRDPLYEVELIVFLHASGNPYEEDLTHGSGLGPDGPAARRLRPPQIELETLFGFDPSEPESGSDSPGRAEPIDATDVTADPAGDALELIERSDRLSSNPLASEASELPVGFAPLERGALELGDIYARLDRLDAYRALAHVGWIQAGVDQERAKWLDLKHLGVTNPQGSVRVRLGRFFFVALDLTVVDGTGSFWAAAPGPGFEPLERAPSYAIKDERSAIRSGELHGFDHPLIGALVRITRAPEADAAAGEVPEP
jgi:hypothetical protein